MQASINELHMMTGRRRDTITRLLNVSGLPFTQEGDYDTAPKKYDTIKALPVIYGLEGSDLFGAIGEAEHNQTRDPQSWLTKAAQARGKRRQTGPPKRVGFV